MSENFYYLKQPIPLDLVYEIKYFTKGFQVDWSNIGNKGFCPLMITYEGNIVIVHWKNNSQFGEMITHFEIENDANNNPMNILNLLNAQFNLEWKD